MADPPFALLLVAPDDSDRRLVGGLLDAGASELQSVTGVRSALGAIVERAPDVVLLEGALASEASVRRLVKRIRARR